MKGKPPGVSPTGDKKEDKMKKLFCTIRKDPDAGKDWGQKEKGATEDEMVGWHH